MGKADMVPIASKGKQTTLGSIDAYAKKDEESPRPTALFAYDFSMDSTEVTQSDFETLMGRNPATEAFGFGRDYPVYNVSFYDAVLYCNARSKREKLDTVYEYAVKNLDANGRAFELTGLVIQYARAGYRLPTEAEWEYAARAGIETAFPWGDNLDSALEETTGWFNRHAGGKSHPVAKLPANAFGLHDMLGNVMEWTNDWKRPYAAIVIHNSLGARNPGLVPERVVKGGAFSYDARYLRYSGRSANYATISSAAVEYVGFRCVLGVIVSGQYLDGDQAHEATPEVVANADAVIHFFGHDQLKAVFVNATLSSRTLCYLDYSEKPLLVHEFLDDTAVFTPVISPDGLWVAYGNVDEGDRRNGSVSVRPLRSGSVAVKLPVPSACIPRWWVGTGGSDTSLIYTTNAVDNTDPAWKATQTHRVKVLGGVAVGVPELLAAGGYHDGLSNDSRFLATGYRHFHLLNRINSLDRILFTGPSNGKLTGDTSQVCNVSLHPNFGISPEALLLDFGYAERSSVVGRAYGLHEILFRIDTSGRVSDWYRAPKGYLAWQDAEWSNHADFAVATGEDGSLDYPVVLALNLKDSATVVVARGSNLRQPGLWVKPGAVPFSSVGADSLGKYNEPVTGYAQASFAAKMKVFWSQLDSIEVVSLGSSHIDDGIRPDAFQHFHAVNLGYPTAILKGPGEVLKNYVLPHCKKLQAVIFEFNPAWLYWPGGDNNWESQMSKTLGYNFDRAHRFWVASVPASIARLSQENSPNLNDNGNPYDDRGGSFVPAHGWGATPPNIYPIGSGKLPDSTVESNSAILKSLMDEVGKLGVYFVLVLTPESPAYKNTPYFGNYGPTWRIGKTLTEKMQEFCEKQKYCKFYDAYRYGNHDYDSLMFTDEGHLSTTGALQLSHRLDSLIFESVGPRP